MQGDRRRLFHNRKSKSLSTKEKNIRESRALTFLVIAVLMLMTLRTWLFSDALALFFGYCLGCVGGVFWVCLRTDQRQRLRTADHCTRAMP
jgi:amino acid permease